MLDFHNHLIPAVDDGAASIAESLLGLRRMADDGVTAVITTPHLNGSLTNRPGLQDRLDEVESQWRKLEQAVEIEVPSIEVFLGAEVMLDVPDPDLSDPRARLAGTMFTLIEFPFFAIPPRSEAAIALLSSKGIIPVIAHPERYGGVEDVVALAELWCDAGAFLQVNTGSLIGDYGKTAKKKAWELVESGCASYLASDYHSRGRCSIGPARDAFRDRHAEEQFEILASVNPRRIVASERPIPVHPVRPKKGIVRRIVQKFSLPSVTGAGN